MTEETVSSTHPLLPPTSEDDRLDRLRLLRSRRVGVSTYKRLLSEHGTARAALEALPDVARAAGLLEYRACPMQIAEGEYRAGERLGARLVFQGEADFPHQMSEIDDAPPMLWMRGNTELAQTASIALVGARNASSLGTRMSRALANDLGRAGFTIVSGMARGVDTAAHLASLKTGTIAVFAGGVDVFYPAENTRLGEDIASHGLIVSEQPIGLTPIARHFPLRNRIISALSQAMVVVEAAAKSGSLIAARHALDQGREVLAVPGHPMEPRAAGCNMLIRDGAKLVRHSDDILEALSTLAPDTTSPPIEAPAPQQNLRQTAQLHGEILARLAPAPMAEDQLIRSLDMPANVVTEQLTDLELEGYVERATGGVVRRLN
ncbi:DNA-processing protein DprA [Primorskyibacter sp. S187A]|uniref:DNA-processing protein DprA n=1 Tax=Primorskyibacter sp. S187A TaxID=3415130 RepID=UPI003C7DA9DD